jgi:Mg/Co/Ni transporter MgtE
MNISSIIDQNYACLSVMDDIRQVTELLKERECFAVIDEELQTVGIITISDIVREKRYQLIDIPIDKPQVSPAHTLEDVLRLMQTHSTAHLPVYESYRFIGIISLPAIAGGLLVRVRELEFELAQYQKGC